MQCIYWIRILLLKTLAENGWLCTASLRTRILLLLFKCHSQPRPTEAMSRTRSSRTPYSVWRWLGFLLREKVQAGSGNGNRHPFLGPSPSPAKKVLKPNSAPQTKALLPYLLMLSIFKILRELPMIFIFYHKIRYYDAEEVRVHFISKWKFYLSKRTFSVNPQKVILPLTRPTVLHCQAPYTRL